MNAKLVAGGITAEDCDSSELLNPFVHHLKLETTTEKIKTALLTILLLPIRVALICILLSIGWMLACVGLFGISEEDLRTKPLTGWRRKITHILCLLGKTTFRAGGMNIVIKGKQATRQEAPILVIAPHSTFLDGGIVYFTGFPSIIVRRESGDNWNIGKLINFTQPVYVWRDDPDSRHNTIKEIIARSTSDLDWPQILIFPEGTCTNRSCLITFKPGAFYPGVPIQPVCIRYPNKLDTVTWTWEGPSALKLLWLTLTQVYSSCEIEFLPVYRPSEAEKRDPKLFASNVRAVMAKALGVPVSDYTYDDCKLFAKAKEMNLPNSNALVEALKLRNRLGLNISAIEDSILQYSKDFGKVSLVEFASILKINPGDVNTQQLFRLYDKNGKGYINLCDYMLGVMSLTGNRSMLEVLNIACKLYDSSKVGKLSKNDFSTVLTHTLNMSEDEAGDIFETIDKECSGFITYNDFLEFAEKKAEFAGLFSISTEEKFKPKEVEVSPSNLPTKKTN